MPKDVTHTQSTDGTQLSLLPRVWHRGTEERPLSWATLACSPQQGDLGLGSVFLVLFYFVFGILFKTVIRTSQMCGLNEIS